MKALFRPAQIWLPTWRVVAGLVLFAVMVAGSAPVWGPAVVAPLVADDPGGQADVVVVEIGPHPEKALFSRAARLQRDGRVSRVAVVRYQRSARLDMAGIEMPDRFDEVLRVYWQDAGLQDDIVDLVPVGVTDPVTLNLARQVAAWCETQKIRSVIVVTGLFHSRRSLYAYRKFLQPLSVRVTASPASAGLDVHNWWRTKDGIQDVFQEWVRLVYYKVALL
jgi:hypothetical protein